MTLHLELVCYIIAVFSEVTSLPKARHLASIKSHPVERSIPTLDETSAKRIDQQLIGSTDEKDKFMQLPKIEWEAEDHELSRISACDRWNTPGRHMIYCSGKLLQAVMATRLHSDSKTFVDRPMKENRTGQFILDAFKKQFPQPVSDITQSDVRKFVDQHFDEEGHELQGCDLDDWSAKPDRLNSIVDRTLRSFALNLNLIWKDLCRKVKPVVKTSPQRFSLLYVPYPFIIPGGRFREYYYWDAYWIIKGLLTSGMTITAKRMILNFAHMIETYGFIPNGGRVYYLKRSQPPLFAPMVYDYYQNTKDIEFIREMLPVIEKEHEFWRKNRTVEVKIGQEVISMFQYRTEANVPRPESYREDIISADKIEKEDDKKQFYQNLASAAESGWDFSSRWLADRVTLTTIETTNIAPVDLNAFLCYNMNIISYLHGELGNTNKESSWVNEYIKFRDAFKKVFYVAKSKGWYDYNLVTKKHNFEFYASIAVPLFTQCYDPLSTSQTDDLYNQMEEMGVFKFAGGIPTSLQNQSHEQWDFPNGWSPLNHMIIEGLRKSTNPRMQQKAFQLAEKWLLSNLRVFEYDRAMWEKYDVVSTRPRTGSGGEYKVQVCYDYVVSHQKKVKLHMSIIFSGISCSVQILQLQAGFGWTNGAALDLLITYGDRLRYPGIHPPLIPVPQLFQDKTFEETGLVSSLSYSLSTIGLTLFLCLLCANNS